MKRDDDHGEQGTDPGAARSEEAVLDLSVLAGSDAISTESTGHPGTAFFDLNERESVISARLRASATLGTVVAESEPKGGELTEDVRHQSDGTIDRAVNHGPHSTGHDQHHDEPADAEDQSGGACEEGAHANPSEQEGRAQNDREQSDPQ